jgi:hypothetical protein
MRKILAYSTCDEIPEGAEYLSTKVETEQIPEHRGDRHNSYDVVVTKNVLVWHYFLVEVEEKDKSRPEHKENYGHWINCMCPLCVK